MSRKHPSIVDKVRDQRFNTEFLDDCKMEETLITPTFKFIHFDNILRL